MSAEQKKFQYHTLSADPGRQQVRKRVGRGESSGMGKTSGKGHKGAQARKGPGPTASFEGGQMPLIRRIPKFGFINPFRVAYEVVNITSIDKLFEEGAVVDHDALRKARLVRTKMPVKVLGEGAMTKRVTVYAHKFSQSAKEKIETAGGSVVVIDAPEA
ncbi:MAG: 50S ribosomal protein L15 [Candidatus Sumerlaeia bacterium]|nr:50S ribosomal protein L15 [Candidatus Sumerlaeia bacterium]